jgi:hypothetical protein
VCGLVVFNGKQRNEKITAPLSNFKNKVTPQCSGKGICKPFNPDDISNPVNFCECDAGYADPGWVWRR